LGIALLAAILLGMSACGSDDDEAGNPEAELTAMIRSSYVLEALPAAPPYPPDNGPQSAGYPERVALGRLLFFDPILSGDQDVACGTCHHPAFAWADGRALSIGVGGVGLGPDRERTLGDSEFEFMTPRNSPTVLDAGFNRPPAGKPDWEGVMFWDGRTSSLEAQARAPIRSRDEMRHDAYPDFYAVQNVIAKLRAIPGYVERFAVAFPEAAALLPPERAAEIIDSNTYARAIAAYERELYTADSPFDRFARGDDAAMSFAQKRGLDLFWRSGCAECHSGAMFSDFGFCAIGVLQAGPGKPPIHERGDGSDEGRYAEDGLEEHRYAFRTPSLRNVALTAPYFHTGGEASGGDYGTLRQVLEFFNRGCNDQGLGAQHLHPSAAPLGFSSEQIDDLVAFLESLSSTRLGSPYVDPTVPEAVPSGLAPPEARPPVLTR
jgi:cytochrome c peroxidase